MYNCFTISIFLLSFSAPLLFRISIKYGSIRVGHDFRKVLSKGSNRVFFLLENVLLWGTIFHSTTGTGGFGPFGHLGKSCR